MEHFLSSREQKKCSREEKSLLRKVLDSTGKGYVFPSNFANFLKTFGPFGKVIPSRVSILMRIQCMDNLLSLASKPWFHGFLSPDEATRLLSEKPKVDALHSIFSQYQGTYLIRFSFSRMDILSLEYVVSKGTSIAVKISCDMPNGVSLKEGISTSLL